MEDRKNIYLDKVIDYIVDDTIIDYENRSLFFPFLPTLSPFPFYLFPRVSFTSFYNPIFLSHFLEYCKENYGLTEEEIKYVWDKYTNIILEKIDMEAINESVDSRKDDYLNKVLNYLVDDTMVDHKNKTWYPPFPTPHPHSSIITLHNLIPMTEVLSPRFLMENSYVRYFFNYCSNTYGLSDFNEIKKLWVDYLNTLRDKINGFTINESVDRKSEYLNLILNILLDDSIITHSNRNWWLESPWIQNNGIGTPYVAHFHTILPFTLNSTSEPFGKYCKDTYGLTDNEIYDMWRRYRDEMWKRYYKLSSSHLNETVDRKSEYLDKIVDWLFNDTEVGVNYNWFSPIYYYPGSTSGRTNFKSVYGHTFGLLKDTSYSGLETQLIYFNHYCKEQYGLTDEECKIVWKRYMKKLYHSYGWVF